MELHTAVSAVVVLIAPEACHQDRPLWSEAYRVPAAPYVPVARRHVSKTLEDLGLAAAHGHDHGALILDPFLLQCLFLVELLAIRHGENEEGRSLQKARQHVHDLLNLRSN